MLLKSSAATCDRALKTLSQQLNALSNPTLHTPPEPEIWQFPSPMCSGAVRRWKLRPGLDLRTHQLEFKENVVIQRNCSQIQPQLGLSFCVSGKLRCTSPQSQQTFDCQAGQVSLGVFNDSQSQIEYMAKQPISLVHLHVQPEAVGLSHPQELQSLPVALQDALNGHRPAYFQSSPMTPVMSAIVQQLLNCPYQGLSERLYLESKALELMSLSFDSLLSREVSSLQTADLCQDEVDRIYRARDILLSRLTNPPTLLELAHEIGLNDRKLKQGFRKLFGTTVFGYLHDYRMQQAQQLLQLPKATVASVAQSIGYSNPEAFSVAFRRTFAITPKAYQIRHR